jgi:hypothetical protein
MSRSTMTSARIREDALGFIERFDCAITIILQVLSQGQIPFLASVVVMILLVLSIQ